MNTPSNEPSSEPEFSRSVDCIDLGSKNKTIKIEASEVERTALAKHLGLVSLDKLDAEAVFSRGPGDTFNVSGRLRADIVQSCVVTLAPVASSIDAPFEIVFSDSVEPYFGNESEPAEESGTGEYDREPPESLTDGCFDLGETVAEQLSLEMDDFPRADGVAFEGYSSGRNGGEKAPEGPFAALAKLENKQK